MADVSSENVGTGPSRLGDTLGSFIGGNVRPKERLAMLGELAGALVAYSRDLPHLTERAAELLAGSVSRLPIRSVDELRTQYGVDTEVAAARLVEEAGRLAAWVSTTAAAAPGPPPVVHTLKVLVHSAIEIRLVGELYALYGDGPAAHDPAWLTMVTHAWAVGHPVTGGASSAVNAREIAVRLRQSYLSPGGDHGRVTRLVHRGRDGTEAIRLLGGRFRRRLRPHPSAWPQPDAASTATVVREAVADVVHSKLGRSASSHSDDPRQRLAEGWTEHRAARAAAGLAAGDAAQATPLPRLGAALDLQEGRLGELAARLRRPRAVSPGVPAQRQGAGTRSDHLAAAHLHLSRADDAIDRIEETGSRPRRLGGWQPWVRNGMGYVVAALLVAVPTGWLIAQSATGLTAGTWVALALASCGLPFLACGIGWFAVGWLFRPWLGGPVPRSPIIGLLISFLVTVATLVVVTLTT